MKSKYNATLKAQLTIDNDKIVRHIRHTGELAESGEDIPRLSAQAYLLQVADTYKIPGAQLQNLHKKVSFKNPVDKQGVEFQQSEEKHMFDSTVISYYQTYRNVPVWRKGITVNIKQNPNRVVGSHNNSEYDIKGELPDEKVIERYKKAFAMLDAKKALDKAGIKMPVGENEEDAMSFFSSQFRFGTTAETSKGKKAATHAEPVPTQILNARFFFYKYDSQKRYDNKPEPNHKDNDHHHVPFPELPPVHDAIKNGTSYLVAEVTYKTNQIVWLVLMELVSGDILFIRPLTCGLNGLVFKYDPNVATGDLTITSADSTAKLNMYRNDVTLTNLDAPVMGTQHLRGTYISIEDFEQPTIPPPTKPAGTDFDFDSRTNDFAAVNAYYHQNNLFTTIESLGFPITTYFDGTDFPIPVDHRTMWAFDMGNTINAFWEPNGMGGTKHMGYALCDLTNLTEPLGRSVDPWVHWHEMGGHGTLGDHVNSGLLGFAHSTGDGLAAIQMDPESKLRGVPERFRYAPFRPIPAFSGERRFDRDTTTWAWGSANDTGAYDSEQILATCHFRMYRSMGGDSDDLNRRKFASRAATYLILRTTGHLAEATNPDSPEEWCDVMETMDLENWTSEGMAGGAYNKLAHWAFEVQGAYGGTPPDVDVYINDGRNGEYQYQPVHWHTTSQWNRNAADGLTAHQNAIKGETNYMYVKIKNRGTTTATNVRVKGFHCLPGAGLTWPTDFTEMGPTGGIAGADVDGNNAEEIIVGPFEWIPNENIYGHDCTLMIVTATGDASNIDHFTMGETIEEWRLVPHDNNIGQRNVTLVAGAEGESGLMNTMDGAIFVAGNPSRRRADMEIKIDMPPVLTQAGWKLQLSGVPTEKFVLKSGEKRKIMLKLAPGNNITQEQIRNAGNRDIMVSLYGDGGLLGGMTYRIDPDLKAPISDGHGGGSKCNDKAADLLDCLNLGGGKVKNVRMKKVSIDIEMDNNCDCK